MNTFPFISVCIPSYNRAERLPELLDSIFCQDFDDYEVIICEDFSPQRAAIKKVVDRYSSLYPKKIKYFENLKNFGYDRNFRELIAKSTGEFCVFLGNDDLLEVGALSHISESLAMSKNPGAFLRTYSTFSSSKEAPDEVFRYFPDFKIFPPGLNTVGIFFRRFVVISGLGIHRETANSVATDRFDGTLLYQLYIVSKVLLKREGIYSPRSVALYRKGGVPDFGNSEKEQGKFVPGNQTPKSSLHFIEGFLRIAKDVSCDQPQLYDMIIRDFRAYSYPLLAIQSNQKKLVFFKYTFELAKLGFSTSLHYWIYFLILIILGRKRSDQLIKFIKTKLGFTPKL